MITLLLKKHSIKNNDQKLVLRKYSPYRTVWWYFNLILIAYKIFSVLNYFIFNIVEDTIFYWEKLLMIYKYMFTSWLKCKIYVI